MKRDKIHFTGQHMDSYNATWNFIWSARESGKTTSWVIKAYKFHVKYKATIIVLRYLIADITDTYISDLSTVLTDFDYDVKFKFKKTMKEGIIDVFVDGEEDEVPIFRFIALSNPISRIKSMKLKNAGYIVLDEFILNTRVGEKYPVGLVTRFKELYNTYLRCCHTGKKFKLFCYGNPYSKFHPLLSNLKVNTTSLKEGDFIYNKETDTYCEAYKLKDELKQYILAHNPLYKFDDAYSAYAFNGETINDTNFIIVEQQPENYTLNFIFRIQNKYLLIYKDTRVREYDAYDTGKYWIACSDTYKGNRNIYAVDLDNLIEGTVLITTNIRALCYRLSNSIANRDVSFNSIEAGYLTEDIYNYIK